MSGHTCEVCAIALLARVSVSHAAVLAGGPLHLLCTQGDRICAVISAVVAVSWNCLQMEANVYAGMSH